MKEKFDELYLFMKENFKYSEWYQQITLEKMTTELSKEVQEALEEVQSGNMEKFKTEIGDVLWDLMAILVLAENKGILHPKEVISNVLEKFKKRKPFVLEQKFTGSDEELRIWKETKQMEKEMIDIVDKEDNVIGTVSRKEIRSKNLLHKVVFVFVFNSNNEVLITKRTMSKDVYPGLWETCRAGTVDAGESYEMTAKRELQEEVGIEAPLKFIGSFSHEDATKRCNGQVFSCRYDGELTLQKEEITESKFITFDELITLTKEHPETFCGDQITALQTYETTQTI